MEGSWKEARTLFENIVRDVKARCAPGWRPASKRLVGLVLGAVIGLPFHTFSLCIITALMVRPIIEILL